MNAPGSPSSPLQMRYFSSPGLLCGERPLRAGREPRAAAAADARVGDALDDPLGRLLGQREARGLVAAAREALLDALRVDDPDVAQGDARLLLVEADLVPVAHDLAGRRVLVHELLDGHAVLEVLVDDLLDVLGLEPAVERVVRAHREGALRAEPVTADDRDLDLVVEPGRLDLFDEGVVDGQRAGEHAGGAGADRHPQATVAGRRDLDVARLGGLLAAVRARVHCRFVTHETPCHPFWAPTCSIRSRMTLRVLSGVRLP